MKNMIWKRLISGLLALVLLVGNCPVGYATEVTDNTSQTQTDGADTTGGSAASTDTGTVVPATPVTDDTTGEESASQTGDQTIVPATPAEGGSQDGSGADSGDSGTDTSGSTGVENTDNAGDNAAQNDEDDTTLSGDSNSLTLSPDALTQSALSSSTMTMAVDDTPVTYASDVPYIIYSGSGAKEDPYIVYITNGSITYRNFKQLCIDLSENLDEVSGVSSIDYWYGFFADDNQGYTELTYDGWWQPSGDDVLSLTYGQLYACAPHESRSYWDGGDKILAQVAFTPTPYYEYDIVIEAPEDISDTPYVQIGSTKYYNGDSVEITGSSAVSLTIPNYEPQFVIKSFTVGSTSVTGYKTTLSATPSCTITVEYEEAKDVEFTIGPNKDGYGEAYFTEVGGTEKVTDSYYNTRLLQLHAAAAEGKTFSHWLITENGTTRVVTEATSQIYLQEGAEYIACFEASDNKFVAINRQTGIRYLNSDLPNAFEEAVSGQTIVLTANATLSEDITIPAGVTFLLPYQAGQETVTTSGDVPYSNSYTEIEGKANTTVTNALVGPDDKTLENVELTVKGAKITVASGGVLVTGGWIGSTNGGLSGQTCGWHSDIVMDANSQIEVNGILSSCGYITGGKINVTGTGTVYEPFIICDYRGGSYTAAAYQTAAIAPFSEYAMINIQSDMDIAYGGSLKGYADLYTGATNIVFATIPAQHNRTTVSVIGTQSALIQTISGSVELRYNPNRVANYDDVKNIGHTDVTINGGANFGSMSLKITVGTSITVNTANLVFPIPFNYTLNLKNGDYNINSDFKILPGAEVYVAHDAKLIMTSGDVLQVYDGMFFREYGGTHYPNGSELTYGDYSEIGRLVIDGELNVGDGATFRGMIQTSGSTGKIIFGNVDLTTDKTIEEGLLVSQTYLSRGPSYANRTTKILDALIWDYSTNSLIVPQSGTTYYAVNGDTDYVVDGEQVTKKLATYDYTTYDNSDVATDVTGVAYHKDKEPILEGSWISPEIKFSCGCDADHAGECTVANITLTAQPGSTVIVPQCTKTGYTFQGWYVDADSNGVMSESESLVLEGNSDTMPALIETVKPNFTENTYTIEFAGGKGTTDDAVTGSTASISNVGYDDPVTLPANDFSLYGHSFNGWLGEDGKNFDDGQGNVSKLSAVNNDTYTMTAQWTANPHTLTFNADGGTMEVNQSETYATTVNYGVTLTDYTASRTGYTFGGWYTDKEGKGTKYYEGDYSTMPDSDLTLYAKWDPVTYTIQLDTTHEKGAGTVSGWTMESEGFYTKSFTMESTEDITLPDAVKTGYTFNGWTDENGATGWGVDADGNPISSITPADLITNFAKYNSNDDTTIVFKAGLDAKKYSITLNGNGGTTISGESTAENDAKGTYDSAVFLSANPFSRVGYTFLGWSKNANSDSAEFAESAEQMILGDGEAYSENVTLYAVWSANSYTVSLNPNGGTVNQTSVGVTYDGTYDLPTPTREGYRFDGWYNNGNVYASGDEVTITDNTTFTAKWTIESYTLTFDSNGGSQVSAITASYGNTFIAPTPTREGYTFMGWSPEVPSTMPDYGENGAEVTFTAQWEIESYTITFANTGDSNVEDITAEYGAAITAPENPTWNGYNFDKWDWTIPSTMPDLGDNGATKIVTASWTPIRYKITVNLDGGGIDGASSWSGSYDITAAYTLPTPSRTGYTFANWEVTSGEVTLSNGQIPAGTTGDVVLTAKWNPNTNTAYTVKHWLQNLNGGAVEDETNFELKDTDNLTGTSDTSVTPDVKSYEGFTAPDKQTVTIAADGSTVVNYYYTRNSYKVGLTAGDGIASVSGAGTYQYGAIVTIKAELKTGYSWSKWSDVLTAQQGTFTMGADDVNLTATATAIQYHLILDGVKSDVVYTVETKAADVQIPDPSEKTGYDFSDWAGKPESEYMPAKDISLTSQWVPKNYTITVKTHSGTKTIENVPYDTKLDNTFNRIPADATDKEGYTFIGWFTEDGTQCFVEGCDVTMPEGLTVIASYTANEYTIHYNGNGSDGVTTVGDQTAVYDSDVTWAVNTYTRTGYTFNGWNTQANGEGTAFQAGKTTSKPNLVSGGEVTLYAQWTANQYTVKFDGNDAAGGSTADIEATYDADVILPECGFTKTGYTFAGWSCTVNGNTATYKPGDKLVNLATGAEGDNEVTITAIWTANTYRISYNLNYQGALEITDTTDVTYDAAYPALLTDPVREGYRFDGWYDAETGGNKITSGEGKYQTAGGTTLYAHWTAKTYSINLYYNYAENDVDKVVTVIVTHDQPYSYGTGNDNGVSDSQNRAGYSFGGWYTDAELKNRLDIESTVDAQYPANLYANWIATDYTITFKNADNWTINNNAGFSTTDLPLTLNAPTRVGYTFIGWSKDAEGKDIVTKIEDIGDVTLYLISRPNTYSVVFDGNGGKTENDSTTASQTGFVYDQASNLNTNPFTRDGYSFAGWKYDGTTYADKASVENLTSVDSGTVTLVAQWTPVEYTITYNSNGGTLENPDTTYTIEESVTLPTPQKAGYTFKGWYEDDKFSGNQITGFSGATGNKTYYAKWEVITYTVGFNLDGGEADKANPETYTVEDTITLNNPTKVGYTFVGWTGSNGTEAQTAVTISKGTTGDLNYTANWTPNTDTAYKVQHWLQNLAADNEQNDTNYKLQEKDTQNLTGTTAASVTPAVNSYEGFTAPDAKTVTIVADGSTVVNYYYTRNSYKVGLIAGNGIDSVSGGGTYQFGANVTINAVLKAGYSWNGWTGSETISDQQYTFTMPAKAVELTATTRVNSYDIEYDLGGGTMEENVTNPDSYDVEDTIVLKNPSKTGYTFDGWTGSNGTTADTSVEISGETENKKYTANWTANQYMVVLNAGFGSFGETETMTIKVTYDSTFGAYEGASEDATALPKPTRIGYIFDGWYVTEQNSVLAVVGDSVDTSETGRVTAGSKVNVSVDEDIITGESVLYAHWTPITYTVQYDLNGGTVEDNSLFKVITATYNNTGWTIPAEEPTKTGYQFDGWKVNNTSAVYSAGVIVNENLAEEQGAVVTLTAQWKANTYSVRFNANYDNAPVTVTQSGFVYDVENKLQTNTYTRTGYTFQGWGLNPDTTEAFYVDEALVKELTTEQNGTVDLYAVWTANTYSVKFDPNFSGENVPGIITQDGFVYDVETALQNNSFTRGGYTFQGWAVSSGSTEIAYADKAAVENLSSDVNGVVTLYAVWSANAYTVIFDGNGGTTTGDETGSTEGRADYIYDSTSKNLLSATYFTRRGYTFNGWNTKVDGSGVSYDAGKPAVNLAENGEITLYAQWKANTYTIVFVGNNATGGSTESQNMTYDVQDNLNLNGFIKTGHSFLGWSETSGGQKVYEDGAAVKNLTTGTVAYLHAVWQVNTYDVNFMLNSPVPGAEESLYEQTKVSFGSNLTLPGDNPAIVGYEFQGWYTEKDGGSRVSAATALSTEGATYYAHWKIKTNTIILNLSDCEMVGNTDWKVETLNNKHQASCTADYGTEISVPPVPTRTGYSFQGWFDADDKQYFADAEGTAQNETMPAESIELTPKWQINQYTITFDTDGGDEIDPITQDYDTTVDAPADPEKTGYSFTGWDKTIPAKMPAENVTIKATWKIKQYTISFDSLEGGDAVDTIKQDYDTPVTAPDDPERKGYIFKHWSYNGSEYEFTTMPAQDITLTAVYDSYLDYLKAVDSTDGTTDFASEDELELAREYYSYLNDDQKSEYSGTAHQEALFTKIREVSVQSLRESVVAAQENTNNILANAPHPDNEKETLRIAEMKVFDENLTADPPAIEGMIIESEYPAMMMLNVEFMTELFAFEDIVSIVCDNDLVPDEVPKEHVLTGKTIADAGTLGSDQFNIMLVVAWAAIMPNADYETFFNYLYENRQMEIVELDGKGIWATLNAETPEGVKYSVTYRIEFFIQTHNVIYDLGYDGDSDGANDTVVIPAAYETDVNVIKPVRTGYSFAGWTTNDVQITNDSFTMGKTDVTLFANWTLENYPVHLNLDGGELDANIRDTWENLTYNVNQSTDIKLPTPEKEGYEFLGWTGSNGDTPELDVIIAAGSTGEKTYTANWEINQYTITFDSSGGTGVIAITQDYASGITAPTAPTRLGYTFTGWSPALPETMPAQNMTVTAQWSKDVYEIAYEGLYDWENKNPTSYDVDSAFTLTNPTRTGYTFLGWSGSGIDGMSKTVAITAGTVGNRTYTANWQINSHTITLDPNGGEMKTTEYTYDFGDTVSVTEVPVRTGYTFTGWNPALPETMPDSAVTAVAQWEANKFTVTLDPNGGSVSTTTVEVSYGNTFSNLPTATRENYGFQGWFTEKTGGTKVNLTDTVTLSGPITLYAQWKAGSFTISYNLDGGTATGNNPSNYSVESGTIELAKPVREGYEFLGWTGSNGNTPEKRVVIEAGSSGDREYTANWKINQYTVTIVYDNGAEAKVITQNYGTAIAAVADPEREGYTFTGWDNTIPATMPAKDMTITATWKINEYTITFQDHDGRVLDSVTENYQEMVTAIADPSRTGYTFTGWSPEVPATMPAEDMVVTAQYTINQYTITFDTAGGSEIDPITLDYNTEIESPAAPTREGYTFTGWDKEIPESMPAGNMTITASWKINQRTITYFAYDGTRLDFSTQDYGTAITAIAAPERTGYTFIGWEPAVPATMPDEDVTVTATYQVNTYHIYYCDKDAGILAEQAYEYGAEITPLDAPAKEGYTFDSWNPALPETMPAGDLYVYAVWTTQQYELIFIVDGEEYQRVKVPFGDAPGTAESPTKTGYTFSGWSQIPEIMPANDVTITGSFIPNTYTVTFDPNNGQGEMENQKFIYDVQTDLNEMQFSRTGYTFVAWNTAADGSGTGYVDKETVNNLTSVNGGNVRLYAIWVAKTYDIAMDYNGGEQLAATITVTYDQTYSNLPTPTRAGYEFAGWSDGSNSYTSATPVTEPVPEKLTAQWNVQGDTPYTVYHYQQNLNDDGYEIVQTQSLTGATDAEVSAKAESYTGFVLNTDKSSQTGVITADGKLELHLYYDRVEYTVTWKAADKQVQEKYRYEQIPVYSGEKDYENQYAIYTFTGWDSEVVAVTGNVTYAAVYVSSYEASFFDAATGETTLTYARLKDALAAAKNGQTVRLEEDITLEESLTVPAGVNLLLPSIDNDYGYNLVDRGRLKFNHDNPNPSGGKEVLYRQMTILEGITLTVNGNVLINSVSGRLSGGTAEMDVTGGYGKIHLDGEIVVNNGGNLDCFGYVSGSGTVTVKNGGSVGDLFIVRHWRGGTQALAMYQSMIEYGDPADPDVRQTYPMNEYDCHNIETDVVVEYGGGYDGLVKMAANAGQGTAYYYTRFPQVDVDNGLIRLTGEGSYVVRSYDKANDRDTYTIYGGAKFAESSLNIAGVDLSTKDFVYPIDGDICFELHDGDYHFANDYKFLTGGGLTVHSGATLIVDAGVYVALYDEFIDPVNTGNTQYPIRDKMVLTVKAGGKFINAGTFGGSIVTESPDILIGDYPTWGIVTLEANGYTNGTVEINHDLYITREGYEWRYGDPALGEVENSIIWVGADYTALLEALEQVPANLDIYSDETADPLETVIEEVEYGLGLDKQAQVDNWTEQVLDGIAGLKLRVVTVIFNANGGTCGLDSIQITYGNAYGELPVAEYYGFKFLGWYDSDNMLISATSLMQKITDEIVLTAKWEKLPADYTKVNEAIAAIPEDMTGYTEASIQAVYNAEAAVDMTLGLAEQAKVDAMAQAIVDAIANLERVQVKVTLDSNGGDPLANTFMLRYGDLYPYAELPEPVREGYEFVAWYTAKEGGMEITTNTKVTSVADVVLYAKWRDSAVTDPADYSKVEAAKAKVPVDLTPYTAATVNRLNEAVEAVEYGLTIDRQNDVDAWAAAIENAIASLEYKTITVYFDPADGSCDVKSIQVTYGTDCGELPAAVRDYSDFLGWYTAKEGGEKIEASDLFARTENLTVYAHYQLRDADYSEIEAIKEKIPEDLSCYSDDSVDALNKALEQIKDGYTADLQSIVDRWTQELESAWQNLTYRTVTMTYDPQGGKVSPKTASVQYGSSIEWLPEPERAYHIFDGWFTSASGGEEVKVGWVVTNVSDFSIYAHWTQVDADYSGVYEALSKVPEDLTVYTEDSVVTLEKAINAVEYDLNVSYQDQIDKWAQDIKNATAALQGIPVTVTFDYNGGTKGVSSRQVRYGDAYGKYSALPTTNKEGYTFVGWYTAVSGGTRVQNDTLMLTLENHKLYARWSAGEADYSGVEEAKMRIPNLSGYTEESAQRVQNAVGAVEYGLLIDEQSRVDAWADEINAAIAALVAKSSADYTKIEEAKKQIPGDLTVYTEESVQILNDAVNAVEYGLDGSHQDTVDGWGDAIQTAIAGLVVKTVPADYTRVEEAKKQIPADLTVYTEESVQILNNAVNAVKYGLDSSQQETVDGWADAISAAIETLVFKSFVVKLDAIGGNVNPSSITVSQNGKEVELPIPVKEDYLFLGWYTAINGGTQVTQDTVAGLEGGQTLYAHWLYRGMPFVDVHKSEWYYTPVLDLYYAGLVNGVSVDPPQYGPNIATTRGMMITMIWRMMGSPDVDVACKFTDVVPGSYCEMAIIWGTETGVVKGISDTEYAPDTLITREQFATMLYRLYGSPESDASLTDFPDAGDISDFAQDAMVWAVGAGIVTGKNIGGINYLAPKANATRAEVATMIHRYMNLVDML